MPSKTSPYLSVWSHSNFKIFFSGKPPLPTLSLAEGLIALRLHETIAYFNPSNYT